jgi:ubiquinone/menaquinone biosynthesis C-methylase UbiE
MPGNAAGFFFKMHGAPMAEPQIRFEDGAAYERMMGTWSRLVGPVFLEWLVPSPALTWIDVGCGNGSFTEQIVELCAPAEVQGVDPSEGQLAFARTRPAAKLAQFTRGDAMELPFPAKRFDVAIMALVIFFVPDPAKAVAEMVRVTRPGGTIAAYAWDIHGGGFPLEPMWIEMRALNIKVPQPPSSDASRIATMRELWTGAGIEAVETRSITVQRTFSNFEEFWTVSRMGSSVGPVIGGLAPGVSAELKERVRARLPADAAGRVTCSATANAVKGRLPA